MSNACKKFNKRFHAFANKQGNHNIALKVLVSVDQVPLGVAGIYGVGVRGQQGALDRLCFRQQAGKS